MKRIILAFALSAFSHIAISAEVNCFYGGFPKECESIVLKKSDSVTIEVTGSHSENRVVNVEMIHGDHLFPSQKSPAYYTISPNKNDQIYGQMTLAVAVGDGDGIGTTASSTVDEMKNISLKVETLGGTVDATPAKISNVSFELNNKIYTNAADVPPLKKGDKLKVAVEVITQKGKVAFVKKPEESDWHPSPASFIYSPTQEDLDHGLMAIDFMAKDDDKQGFRPEIVEDDVHMSEIKVVKSLGVFDKTPSQIMKVEVYVKSKPEENRPSINHSSLKSNKQKSP